MTWEPENFLIAEPSGPREVAGYVFRSLGLHLAVKGRGRRAPEWSLTHLGTGHRLCVIKGKVAVAFPIATEIAECGDWDWDGFLGYRNRDPELPLRFAAIVSGHKECHRRYGRHHEEIAREIAEARAV